MRLTNKLEGLRPSAGFTFTQTSLEVGETAETQAALAARLPGRRARGHDYLFELTLDLPARLVGPEVQGWSHLLIPVAAAPALIGLSGARARFRGNTRLSGRLTVLKPLKPLKHNVMFQLLKQ